MEKEEFEKRGICNTLDDNDRSHNKCLILETNTMEG